MGHVPDTVRASPTRVISLTGVGLVGGGGVGVGVGVGAGVGVGVGVGVGAGVGVGVGVGGAGAGVGVGGAGIGDPAACCVALARSVATAIVTGRSAPVFADTTTRSRAAPVPDGGVTVAHACSLRAVQLHAECVLTVSSASPPALPNVTGMPPSSNRQAAPVCAIFTRWSAIVTSACRVTGSEFSSTRYETVPSPCPCAVEVSAIHDDVDVAVHAQSRETVTARDPVPPAAGNEPVGELLTVAWQRVEAGVVTSVRAELPQPLTARTATQRAIRRTTAGKSLHDSGHTSCARTGSDRADALGTACFACYT